jgi:hypothetical protein
MAEDTEYPAFLMELVRENTVMFFVGRDEGGAAC